MTKVGLALMLGLALCTSPALAWNDHGHMTVAAIAWQKLTPAARKEVASLLRRNPAYATWTQDVPAASQAETAFILAATWPDAIKRDDTYEDVGENGNKDVAPKSGPAASVAAQNVGYTDELRHRYWHFIDEPFSPDGTLLEQPVPPNALTQIVAFHDALKKSPPMSADIRSYDLVWLEHLIGDVHQPLHATSRFTADLKDGDAGGNRVALCDKPKCRDELHGLWDAAVGTGKTVTAAKNKATKIAQGRTVPHASPDPAAWIAESFELAKTNVYVPPIGIGKGPFKADPQYKANARDTAYDHVWLAGNRLAALLNDALQ